MASIFFSHSSLDKPLARRITQDLEAAGHSVWLDERKIHVGHSIAAKIQEGLHECDFVAVLLTKNSVNSGWVQKEWQSVIDLEIRRRNVKILPILADDCEIPPLLIDKRYADLRDYTKGITELLAALSHHKSTVYPGEPPATATTTTEKTDQTVVARRTRGVAALVFALLVGVIPLFAMYLVHGDERMWWYAGTRPHFFYFNLLIAPHALFFLIEPVAIVWTKFLSRRDKALLVATLCAFTAAACGYDFKDGTPGLFELPLAIQDGANYKIGGYTLWEYDRNAERLAPKHAELKIQFKERLTTLARRGEQSWIEIPYYASMFVQIMFAFTLTWLVTFTLRRHRELLQFRGFMTLLAAGSLLFMIWLPMHAAFMANKRLLYGSAGSTQVIYYMALMLLFVGVSWFLKFKSSQGEITIPTAFFLGGQIVIGAVSALASESLLPWLFARDWEKEWYFMLYLFAVAPSLLVSSHRTNPRKQDGVR